MADLAGRVVGLTTGRPVVQLQDLVASLRMFPAGGKPTPVIGCSIDPTKEGEACMQSVTAQHCRSPDEPDPIDRHRGRNSFGYQIIRIDGASPKTHFAQVMVEADYRMKLIGIGLETPPVTMVSYVDKAKPSSSSTLQRWYFVPDYQCLRVSKDGLAMELMGDGVKLVGQQEMVDNNGSATRLPAVRIAPARPS